MFAFPCLSHLCDSFTFGVRVYDTQESGLLVCQTLLDIVSSTCSDILTVEQGSCYKDH